MDWALGTLGLRPLSEKKKSRSKIAYGDQRATTSEQLGVPWALCSDKRPARSESSAATRKKSGKHQVEISG